MNQFKLSKLKDKFILVSNETPKYGEWCKSVRYDAPQKFGSFENSYENECKKIIAGISELPITDFSLLSEKDCKTIGYVDVENTHTVLRDIIQKYNNVEYGDCIVDEICNLFKFPNTVDVEFKTAQFLNDKMFSLEDMKEAIAEAWNSCEDNEDGETFTQCFNRIIQSLQQTSWDVEVEMEDWRGDREDPLIGNHAKHLLFPKIINNSIKIIKIL